MSEQNVTDVVATEVVAENGKNKIKNAWNDFVSKWSKGGHKVSAKDAYLKATYGEVKTDDQRLEDFMTALDELIKMKSNPNNCQFCATIEVPDDLLKYLPQIIGEYKNRDFTIINLKEKLDDIKSNFLFLCWDNKY